MLPIVFPDPAPAPANAVLLPWLLATATDPALRALAQEMAIEEAGHIAMVEQALAKTPDAQVDWATVFGE